MTEKILLGINRVSNSAAAAYPGKDDHVQEGLEDAAAALGVLMMREPGDPPVVDPPATDPPADPPNTPPTNPGDWLGESSVFKSGGAYDWLSDEYVDALAAQGVQPFPPTDKYVDSRALFVNGIDTAETFDLSQLSGKRMLGNSQKGLTGDTVLWGAARTYGTFGTVDDLEVVRTGDFVKQREGHAVYCDLFESSTWRDIRTRQNLAQSGQFGFRPTTKLSVGGGERPGPLSAHYKNGQLDLKAYWSWLASTAWWASLRAHQASYSMTVEGWSSIDDSCGDENSGRSSNPFSFFNPGLSLHIKGMSIKCHLGRPFGGGFRSRGGLMTTLSYGCRVPNLTAEGLEIAVVSPDRPEVSLNGVDQGLIDRPRIVRNSGAARARVAIYDNCKGPITINAPEFDVDVTTHGTGSQMHKLLATKVLKAGQSYAWTR